MLLGSSTRLIRSACKKVSLVLETPSLEPIHDPRNRLSALNFTGGWLQLLMLTEGLSTSLGSIDLALSINIQYSVYLS